MTPEEIKAIRDKLKMSQIEFGDLLGVERRTILRWETGAGRVPKVVAVLARLAVEKPFVMTALKNYVED